MEEAPRDPTMRPTEPTYEALIGLYDFWHYATPWIEENNI